jgi:heme exporter protein B
VRRAVGAVLRKDLKAELRTLESIPAMTLFAVTTFVLFHFGLDRDTLEGDLAAGVLWVTLLFAAVLGQNRLFVAEHEQGGFDGFLLAPVDRTALFVAKAIALFAFLVVVEVVAIPAFAILLLGPDLLDALPGLIATTLLANLGIAIVGTLVAGIAIRTRARDLIGPLLTLPLLVPVILAASEATAPLLAEGGASGPPSRWLSILAIYDLTIGLVAYGVFDFLLED